MAKNNGIWRKYAYLKNRAKHIPSELVKSEVKGVWNEDYNEERQREIDMIHQELDELLVLIQTLKKKMIK